MRFEMQMGSLAFDRDRHFFNIRYLAGLEWRWDFRSEFRGEGLSLDIAWSKGSSWQTAVGRAWECLWITITFAWRRWQLYSAKVFLTNTANFAGRLDDVPETPFADKVHCVYMTINDGMGEVRTAALQADEGRFLNSDVIMACWSHLASNCSTRQLLAE